MLLFAHPFFGSIHWHPLAAVFSESACTNTSPYCCFFLAFCYMTIDGGSKVLYIMRVQFCTFKALYLLLLQCSEFQKKKKQKTLLGQIITMCQLSKSINNCAHKKQLKSNCQPFIVSFTTKLPHNYIYGKNFCSKGDCGKDAEDENTGHGNIEICSFPFPCCLVLMVIIPESHTSEVLCKKP